MSHKGVYQQPAESSDDETGSTKTSSSSSHPLRDVTRMEEVCQEARVSRTIDEGYQSSAPDDSSVIYPLDRAQKAHQYFIATLFMCMHKTTSFDSKTWSRCVVLSRYVHYKMHEKLF